MQSKQESVTKEVKEEENLTRFGWNGKMERERGREREDERREEKEEKQRFSQSCIQLFSYIFRQTSLKKKFLTKKAQQTSFPPSPSLSLFRSRCAVQTAMLLFEFSTFGDFEQKSKFQHRLYFSLSLSRSRYWCFLLNSRVSLGYLLRYTPLRDSVSYEKNWRSGSKKK